MNDATEVAGRYGLGEDAVLSGPVARGEMGRVWRLETPRGNIAVKEFFEPVSEADVREEVDFHEAARGAGVPTPAVVRTVEGNVLHDLGHAQVRVHEWVDLLDRDPDLDPVTVGRVLATLHRVPFQGSRPVDPWYSEPVGAGTGGELVSALRTEGAPFAAELAAYRDELVALETLLQPPENVRTCHRDLWADNLRPTSTGLPCVIDWEDYGLADPSQELAAVLFEFGYRSPARARSLYEAYLDAGGPGRIERRGTFSMAIAQLGHIGEISCQDWLDPGASELERVHHAERAGELMAKPLTREVIDELLEATLRARMRA